MVNINKSLFVCLDFRICSFLPKSTTSNNVRPGTYTREPKFLLPLDGQEGEVSVEERLHEVTRLVVEVPAQIETFSVGVAA